MKFLLIMLFFLVASIKFAIADEISFVRPIACNGSSASSVDKNCPIFMNDAGFIVDRSGTKLLEESSESSVETQYELFFSGSAFALVHTENTTSQNFEVTVFDLNGGKINIRSYLSLSKSIDENGPYWKGVICQGTAVSSKQGDIAKIAFDNLCGESARQDYIAVKKSIPDVKGTLVAVPRYSDGKEDGVATDLYFVNDDGPSLQNLSCFDNCPNQILPATYTGVIDGRLRISMLLESFENEGVKGFYEYDRYKKSIQLEGDVHEKIIYLREKDSVTNKSVAQFQAKALSKTFYVGQWSPVKGRPLSLYFGRRFFRSFGKNIRT